MHENFKQFLHHEQKAKVRKNHISSVESSKYYLVNLESVQERNWHYILAKNFIK